MLVREHVSGEAFLDVDESTGTLVAGLKCSIGTKLLARLTASCRYDNAVSVPSRSLGSFHVLLLVAAHSLQFY